jgi:uncharacterized protein (DUF1697 family)
VAGICVALLRGINVGTAKLVAMADLRALVEELGYGDVRTVLNSGNVVFSAPEGATGDAAAGIQAAVAQRLGVSCRVVALSAAELAAVVADNPLLPVADNPSRLFVAVLADPADRALLRPLAGQNWAPEVLAVGARAAYLWCPGGMAVSRLVEAVSRALGDAVTMRNWATMTKLSVLLDEVGP